jgi:serine phosphatase RsbU (regulator of sigma subunit)
MAVQPDRGERAALDPRALDALADAGRAAARGGRLTEVLQAAVDAAAALTGADVALVRVADPDRGDLEVRAVAALLPGLAVRLEGSRIPLGEVPREESGLEDAPRALVELAGELDVEGGFVLPIEVHGELLGSLELLHDVAFDDAALAGARLAAAQIALGIRAYVDVAHARLDGRGDVLRAAGEALAAGADAGHAEDRVLRLGLELTGAEGAVVWRLNGDGEPERGAAVGRTDDLLEAPARGVSEAGGRVSVTSGLGEPAFGLLQLVFPPGVEPSPELVDLLGQFAFRAAQPLRSADRARVLAAELDQTRALLTVVAQANRELSLSHALETAVEQVSELVGATRLAVYLLEDERLVAAAERGLAGPHVRVAEELLALATGPFRARGLVSVDDVSVERGLAPVADALAEAGIEAAVALPLGVAGDTIGLLAVYPERGRPLTANETQLLAALAGQLAVSVQNALLHERATQLGAELEAALGAERAAAKQLGAQLEISKSFSENLSLDKTLDAVARTMVELLDVDAAVLRMPDARREQLLPLALHVSEQRLLSPVRAILYRPQTFAAEPIRRLFQEREPVVLDAEAARALGGSHALLVPFLEKGSTAAIVPIATPAEVICSLTLLSLAPDRPVDREAIEATLSIGGQAALAIDNARLYQQQKEFADAMRRSLLPQVRPAVEGLDIGEVYAAPARLEIGGDLYDYVALDDGRLAVVLGDVTGHGVEAAADMAMAKFVFRSLVRDHPLPSDFLSAANDVVVVEIAPGKFITMLYLLVDAERGEVLVASAGHPPPRLVAADGTVTGIEARGLALGIEEGMTYDEVRAELEPGGSVVLYTDGVIEARDGGELYGIPRLDALLARRHSKGAEDIAGSVIHSARRYTGGELLDDCAVVVLKRTT